MLQGTNVLRDARTANPFQEPRTHKHFVCKHRHPCKLRARTEMPHAYRMVEVLSALFLIAYNTIASGIYACFACTSCRATSIS